MVDIAGKSAIAVEGVRNTANDKVKTKMDFRCGENLS